MKVSGDRQASDGEVLREWAVAGVGVVFKNGCDVRRELSAGTVEAVLEDWASGPVDLYAVHPGGGQPSRRVMALVDFLAERLGSLIRSPASGAGEQGAVR